MRFFVALAFLICILASCDQNRVYEINNEFSDRTWKITDTARFEFRIKDLSQKYNGYYNIRNSLEYPFARLFVQYTLQDSAGKEMQKKLVSAYLFDQKTGKPFGESGLGDVYDHQFPIFSNTGFKPGKYTLKIEQFMRTDTLKGILAVGVRVERAK
jgi:gliding motility-associated lipoprotein GldH